MYGECAGNFLSVQEFQAKFPAQLAYVQEEYEEALNSSKIMSKIDFAGIFPTFSSFLPALFDILPTLLTFGNSSSCTFLNVQEACFLHFCMCRKFFSKVS